MNEWVFSFARLVEAARQSICRDASSQNNPRQFLCTWVPDGLQRHICLSYYSTRSMLPAHGANLSSIAIARAL